MLRTSMPTRMFSCCRQCVTVHGNILWQPVKQMRMGWEVMWGRENFVDDKVRIDDDDVAVRLAMAATTTTSSASACPRMRATAAARTGAMPCASSSAPGSSSENLLCLDRSPQPAGNRGLICYFICLHALPFSLAFALQPPVQWPHSRRLLPLRGRPAPPTVCTETVALANSMPAV